MVRPGIIRTVIDRTLAVILLVLAVIVLVLVGRHILVEWDSRDYLLAALTIGLIHFTRRLDRLEARLEQLQERFEDSSASAQRSRS